jgi:restriction system protein
MASRNPFSSFLRAAVKASAAAERERQRAVRTHLTQTRQHERQLRIAQTQQASSDAIESKLAKQQYLEDRLAEVDDLNTALDEVLKSHRNLLAHTLVIDDKIRFHDLRLSSKFDPFIPPKHLETGSPPEQYEIPAPSGFKKLIPGAQSKHQDLVSRAVQLFEQKKKEFLQTEADKRTQFAKLKADYDLQKVLHDTHIAHKNAEIDAFETSYLSRELDAIVTYCEMVLSRSEYPIEGFPQQFRVAYNEGAHELLVEYDMPTISVVPEIVEYRYIKAKDSIESKSRKLSESRQLYQDIIASIALRTIHELFEADQIDALTLVTLTGMLNTIDPSNGNDIRIPIISVRAEKTEFEAIKLDKIDKLICLKNLGAKVSSRPDELQAIKPIIEFDMVDKRFIDQSDALTSLESRPNLMELTPGEFEVLVANLFGKMGLETKLTRSSKDGGVDAVAFDIRPILGGKVVIQAKRYKDTVGVSAVRDLYGTMMNEGANKGILVCTSGYGPDAYTFVKDKPIELIDGGGLLYLLREHAGVQARIMVSS